MKSRLTRRQFLAGLGVGLAGCGWQAPYQKKPREAGQGSLRFIFMTDIHARIEWDTPKALQMAAQAINKLEPSLVIAGGDLITEGFDSSVSQAAPRWEAYLQMQRAIKTKVWPVLGNHDLVAVNPRDGSAPAAGPRGEFLRHLGLARTYYSFDAEGYHFVVLDSLNILPGGKTYEGRIGIEQLDWLKADLAGIEPHTPVVVATHIPLMTPRNADPPLISHIIQNSRQVLGILSQHNLVLVLQGHLHATQYLSWNCASFITGGAISGGWWRGNWKGAAEGFSLINLVDGRVESEYLDYGWRARRPADK